jgi:hypothetical protein
VTAYATTSGSIIEPVKPDFKPSSLHSAVTSPRDHERAPAPTQAPAAEPRGVPDAPKQGSDQE